MSELKFLWERQAMAGDEMPDGLPLEEQLAFQALAHLYGRFRLKLLTREDGSKEKGKIAHQLDIDRRRLQVHEGLVGKSAELFKAVESAASQYAKDRTLENADRLYKAVYGMLPGGANHEDI